ncbi:MAG: hypothetical protein V4561_01520 [Bacteroidota bacterium]
MSRLVLFLLYILSALSVSGKSLTDTALLNIDFPISNKYNKFSQTLYYQTNIDTLVNIKLNCYYWAGQTDSIHLYDLTFEDIKIKAGAGYVDLPFSKAVSTHKMHAEYFEVIQRFKMVPAGQYKTTVSILSAKYKDSVLASSSIEQFADSNLSASSGLKEKMNAAVALPKKAKQKAQQKASKNRNTSSSNETQIRSAEQKMKRQLRMVKGLEMHPKTIDGKTFSEAWYKNFFLGRYEMASVKELNERAEKESKQLGANASSMVTNELEGFRSVGSQMKELNAQANKETKLKGNIDVNTYRATAQDPQSAIEQNYTELLGNVEVEFMGLPFNLEGFYTTQDANRKAKASYVRFHYDIETAKAKLQKTISGYKTKLGETVSKGQGLESVYGNYAKSLDAQKEAMLKSMAKEYDIDPKTLADNKGDVNKISSGLPDTKDTGAVAGAATKNIPGASSKVQSAQAKKEKLLKNKKDIEERYKKIEALEQKANKYYKLLEQYRNQNHLDSAINYKKMAGLDDKDASYKDMTKAAAGILPEGKAKNFVTGLTNFDAGIINKYESDYTMAGQTMKGLSVGYDLGFVTTGISAGSTEYVSREGNVDHYSSMLLRVDNKGSKNHKIGILYNVNTPSKAMSQDDNFIGKQNIRYPSFNTPTQITSLVYNGIIGKYLLAHSELATSFKKGQQTNLDMAHSALNNSLEYSIPKTTIGLKAAWEHLGHQFENNVLPYVRTGTDRYTLGTSFDLFQSFLSVKVDYNYLMQQSFASTGYNTKWGFDLKTHSKRYPTISLSYKPFSTFRSFADTLQIAQRPILGEVWTARSSYQIKRHKNVHRFTLMYNKNSSTADTISYSSSTAQLGYIYSNPKLSVTASVSRIELPNNFADGTGLISSYISSIGVNKTIGKSLNVSVSPDISICSWGLQRLSGTVGIVYRMNNKPLTFRTMFRYSNYKLKAADDATELYAGQMGFNWQFKATKKKKVALN